MGSLHWFNGAHCYCWALLLCVFLSDGKKVETIIGAVPKSTMQQAIKKHL